MFINIFLNFFFFFGGGGNFMQGHVKTQKPNRHVTRAKEGMIGPYPEIFWGHRFLKW